MAGPSSPPPDEDLSALNERIAEEGADATTAGARDKAAKTRAAATATPAK